MFPKLKSISTKKTDLWEIGNWWWWKWCFIYRFWFIINTCFCLLFVVPYLKLNLTGPNMQSLPAWSVLQIHEIWSLLICIRAILTKHFCYCPGYKASQFVWSKQSVGLFFMNVEAILFQRWAGHFWNDIKVKIMTNENIIPWFEKFIYYAPTAYL